MKFTWLTIVLLVFTFTQFSTLWASTVEWKVEKTLKVDHRPIDVATSANGQLTFVLTNKGTIFIYNDQGQLKDKFSVGSSIDGIEASPDGERIFLSSGKDKTVQIVSIDFVSNIDTAGSPYKGPPDAPVVIAVYSDFQ